MRHCCCSLPRQLDPLTDLCQRIDRAIVDDPPFSLREGGMIRPGYSEEVDQLRDIMSGGTGTLTAIEAAREGKNRHSQIYGWATTGSSGIILKSARARQIWSRRRISASRP